MRRQIALRPLVRSLVTGSLLATTLLGFGSNVLAAPPQPTSKPAPHTIVSSTGQTVSAETVQNDPDVIQGKRRGLSRPFIAKTAETAPLATGETVDNTPRPDPAEAIALAEQAPEAEDGAAETIIGTDDRYKSWSTTSYPNSAVALITYLNAGYSYRCTGWLIGPNTLVTAGHCVHGGGSGGVWSNNVRVYPGYTGTSAPYGSCGARQLFSVTGWTTSASPEYDYGVIKLDCSVGNSTGWLGYRWQSASLTGQASLITGYPGDKPYEQWNSYDSVRYSALRQLFYQNDTTGGMSGAPVYNGTATCNPCGVAVHSYGLYGGSWDNRGTRITKAVFDNLSYWKSLP